MGVGCGICLHADFQQRKCLVEIGCQFCHFCKILMLKRRDFQIFFQKIPYFGRFVGVCQPVQPGNQFLNHLGSPLAGSSIAGGYRAGSIAVVIGRIV